MIHHWPQYVSCDDKLWSWPPEQDFFFAQQTHFTTSYQRRENSATFTSFTSVINETCTLQLSTWDKYRSFVTSSYLQAHPKKNCEEKSNFSLSLSLNLGLPVFIEAKDDGGGSDNWSYNLCKAPVKSSPPTNQPPIFLQVGCPSCRLTNSVKALKRKYHIPWSCLPQTHLGSSNFVSDH